MLLSKYHQIHYDLEGLVVGGRIRHYLFEKSRICTQNPKDRNYHIFYMLVAGATQELKEKLCLGNPGDYQVRMKILC